MNVTRITIMAGVAALLMGCPPDKPPSTAPGFQAKSRVSSDTLAIVNGEPLTYDEFDRRITALTPYARARFSTIEARREFLDRQIDFELLADYAEKQGYGDKPEVIQATKETMVRQLLQQELAKRVNRSEVTETDVKSAYDASADYYHRPESRRTRMVVCADQAQVAQARQTLVGAEDMKAELDKMANGKACAAFNIGFLEDPNSPRANNTGRNKEVAPKVFELQAPGEWTQPFTLDGRWFIVAYEERRPSKTVPLEDVSDEIREKLFLERREAKRQAFVDELRSSAAISINEEVLSAAKAPPADPKNAQKVIESNRPAVRDLKGPTGASQEAPRNPAKATP